MRKPLLLSCLIFLLFTPTRDAEAFWRWINELSGPGWWGGFDFIFPWSLERVPELEVGDVNTNVRALQSMGLDAVILREDAEAFVRDEAHVRFIERYFDFPLSRLESLIGATGEPDRYLALVEDAVSARGLENFPKLRRCLSDDQKRLFEPLPAEVQLQPPERAARAEQILSAFNDATRMCLREDLGRAIRRFGAGPVGAFGSKRTIPSISNSRGDNFKNLYFNLHLGAAMTFPNNLNFGDELQRENDILWLSTYGALEWRFLERRGGDVNFFVNGGVAGNYFTGSTFTNFPRFSFRGQAGVRYKRLHFALDAQQFTTEFRPEDFGAAPESFIPHQFIWGFSVGVELRKPVDPEVKRKLSDRAGID